MTDRDKLRFTATFRNPGTPQENHADEPTVRRRVRKRKESWRKRFGGPRPMRGVKIDLTARRNRNDCWHRQRKKCRQPCIERQRCKSSDAIPPLSDHHSALILDRQAVIA
jgi:hypothetical protein